MMLDHLWAKWKQFLSKHSLLAILIGYGYVVIVSFVDQHYNLSIRLLGIMLLPLNFLSIPLAWTLISTGRSNVGIGRLVGPLLVGSTFIAFYLIIKG